MSSQNGPDNWDIDDTKVTPDHAANEEAPETRPGPHLDFNWEDFGTVEPNNHPSQPSTKEEPWNPEPITGLEYPLVSQGKEPAKDNVPIRGIKPEASAAYTIITPRAPRKTPTTPKPPKPPVDPNETWTITEPQTEPPSQPPSSVEVPDDQPLIYERRSGYHRFDLPEPQVPPTPEPTPTSTSRFVRTELVAGGYLLTAQHDLPPIRTLKGLADFEDFGTARECAIRLGFPIKVVQGKDNVELYIKPSLTFAYKVGMIRKKKEL